MSYQQNHFAIRIIRSQYLYRHFIAIASAVLAETDSQSHSNRLSS
jgi:hypothetical protein